MFNFAVKDPRRFPPERTALDQGLFGLRLLGFLELDTRIMSLGDIFSRTFQKYRKLNSHVNKIQPWRDLQRWK